jgi:hypothetical protein
MKPIAIIALDWAIRCFGRDHVYNAPTRSLRVAEEAIELVQAFDVPKEKALELVEMVYARPKGTPRQEIGGVMMTITVMCATMGYDTDDVLLTELRRVLEKSPEHFAARNQEKIDLGMDAA